MDIIKSKLSRLSDYHKYLFLKRSRGICVSDIAWDVTSFVFYLLVLAIIGSCSHLWRTEQQQWSISQYYSLEFMQQKNWLNSFVKKQDGVREPTLNKICLRTALEITWKNVQEKWSLDKTFNGVLYFSQPVVRLDLLSPWGQTVAVLISTPQSTQIYNIHPKRSWQIFPKTPSDNLVPISENSIWQYFSHANLIQALWPQSSADLLANKGQWFSLMLPQPLLLWSDNFGQQYYWEQTKAGPFKLSEKNGEQGFVDLIKHIWFGPRLGVNYYQPLFEAPSIDKAASFKTESRPIMSLQEWELYQNNELLEKLTWKWKDIKNGCGDAVQIAKPEIFNAKNYPAVFNWRELMSP